MPSKTRGTAPVWLDSSSYALLADEYDPSSRHRGEPQPKSPLTPSRKSYGAFFPTVNDVTRRALNPIAARSHNVRPQRWSTSQQLRS